METSREYCDQSLEEAFAALIHLKPGECICFVGNQELAKGMVEEASELGLVLEAQISEGFGLHVLTLIKIEKKKPEETNTKISGFSGRILKLLATVLDHSNGRSIA